MTDWNEMNESMMKIKREKKRTQTNQKIEQKKFFLHRKKNEWNTQWVKTETHIETERDKELIKKKK